MATHEVTIGDYVYTLTDGYENDGYVKVNDVTKTSYANLPSTITYSGKVYKISRLDSCYKNCTNLTVAPTLSSNAVTMNYCFDGCTSLTTAPAIPSSVTDMVDCFSGCTSLTTAPTIPSSVTDMRGCFSGCTSLTTAPAIPFGIKSLWTCFKNCTSLTTAPAIPSSVTILYGCFDGCTSLTTAPTIPSSVTNMYFCFHKCTSLTTAPAIPSGVTNMRSCFNGCTSLTTAPTIPSSVTNMYCCFQDCTSLTTAPTIPSGVTNMYCCFMNCTSLTTAPAIPSSVTDMGGCFQSCTSLTTAPTIPSSVTDMRSCFYECTSLTTAPAIPSSVTIIRYCFEKCSSLSGDIQVNNNPEDTTGIFDSTTSHIRIIPQYSTISQEGISKWTSIADAYDNVDIFAPSLSFQSLSAHRVNNSGDISESEEGAYTLLEAVYVFNGLEGDLVTKTVKANGSIIAPTWTESAAGTVITARTWIRQEANQQTTYIVSLSDDYNHAETRSITVTRIEALLDFLDGSKGMGIAFGTIATQPGFYCGMPANVIDANDVMRPLFDFFYPVGSYYETSDALFDPNVTWGGTWVLEEEGLFHISAGNNYVIGTAGGSATHNHTTGDHTLTIDEMPSHTHTQNSHSHKAGSSFVRYINKTSGLAKGSNGYKFFSEDSGLYTDGATATNKNTGGGQAHNHGNTGDSSNIPPHVPVNRWHRTA